MLTQEGFHKLFQDKKLQQNVNSLNQKIQEYEEVKIVN